MAHTTTCDAGFADIAKSSSREDDINETGLDILVHRTRESIHAGRGITVEDTSSYETGLNALLAWCAFLLPPAIAVHDLRDHALKQRENAPLSEVTASFKK